MMLNVLIDFLPNNDFPPCQLCCGTPHFSLSMIDSMTFFQAVFGMNVKEITDDATETISHYAMVSVTFTVLTAWLVVAFQSHSSFHEPGSGFFQRLSWPFSYVIRHILRLLRGQPSELL
jgi:hypothetical protein